MDYKTTPILLLTGYLGSGKTTLVNHILSNNNGIKFAVIVNDIGEVNIDATLIQKGGIVDTKDDSLVAMQNGCICCTLQQDLLKQISDIIKLEKFDYIVIEASGICEPEPIARSICTMQQTSRKYYGKDICRLDNIVTVVDALRLQSEFGCGESLTGGAFDEEDIENLVVQQIEFCNVILLNKISEVEPREAERIKTILKAINPGAEIICCDFAEVDLLPIVNTSRFDYQRASMSAGWVREFDRELTEEEEAEREGHVEHMDYEEEHHGHEHHHEDEEHEHHGGEHHHHDHEEHGHHHDDEHDEEEHEHHHHDEDGHGEHEHSHHGHHHHHHHDGGEVEEYGIGTFVYYRRPAFDLNKFDEFIAKKWNRNIIRAKGICYFSLNEDMSYLFEQAGVQKNLREAGLWLATAPVEEFEQMVENNPSIMKDWTDGYGDRMQKIVFIGQHLDKEAICAELDKCLVK